jgi:hypothetical protein
LPQEFKDLSAGDLIGVARGVEWMVRALGRYFAGADRAENETKDCQLVVADAND